jgi:DNA-binding transcriptional MerR regulator
MEPEARYGIEELAELGGVSRRAVRYYVQEGLLPPPLGVGRGRHYGAEHLDRLLRVKEMQEQGLALAEIQSRLAGGVQGVAEAPAAPRPRRSAWVRLELAPGLELHVSGDRRLPPPGRLAELAQWCRQWFHLSDEETDDA